LFDLTICLIFHILNSETEKQQCIVTR